MTTLVTGAGLIGTAFAQNALARGEQVVFVDPEPRADFLRMKLGDTGYSAVRKDVRDLPGLVETIKASGAETVVHTAGLIGNRVQQSLSAAFDINLGGTRNIAEAVRLTGVRRLVHISTFAVYDRRREATAAITEDFPAGRCTRLWCLQGRQGANPGSLRGGLQFRADHAAAGQRVRARAFLVGLERRTKDAQSDRGRP